ncbi:unnamed protein product [Caenorhabditis angaria]|uniref:G-protein coupled receptors family 1 profile domain-containing protein n=1 Tax=Caenorhabditis angaria TaxID=860376 RepID=A0A9P1N5D4_9PELO|nr:unnamed protein product [Caenorhabditis angaria]
MGTKEDRENDGGGNFSHNFSAGEEEIEESYEESMMVAKTFMTVAYMIVFLIGTPGNIWIIYKLSRAKLWNTSSVQLTVSQRSRIYIFALACSDLILLLTLPPSTSYNYYGKWIFGEVACYANRSLEMFAKLFSVILLTVMSVERYIVVCTRLRHFYRAWMSLVPLIFGIIFGVITPTTIHFFYLSYIQARSFGNITEGMPEETLNSWYCLPLMPDYIFNAFAQYTFFVGFVIPFVIMTICYILLVRHVKAKYKIRKAQTTQKSGKTKEPRYMSEVRKSVWRIAVFHFVCWAPFWGFTMLPNYIHYIMQIIGPGKDLDNYSENGVEMESQVFVYIRLFANCLPYVNAAGNWVLYALLNVDIRKHIYSSQPKKKQRKFSIKFNAIPTNRSEIIEK